MKISIGKYSEALAKSLKHETDKKEIVQRMQNLLKILVKRKQGKAIKHLYEEFKKVWMREHKQIELTVTLPHEATKEELKELADSLSHAVKKEVVLKQKVDKKVIGGMKLEFDDYVIDGTVLKRLEMLKTAITNQS
jgi:F-type H+-transporting ATPase subunit delta